MSGLGWVTAARVLMVAAYAAVSVFIVNKIETRGSPAPVATKNLRANDKLEPGDLQTDATAALIGNYRRQDVALGHPVTPAKVSPRQLPPKLLIRLRRS
jgi:hypothetical protein